MYENIYNFTDILSKQAKVQPHAIAIHAPKGSFTYADVEKLVWKMATYLNRHNVKAGDVVALTYKNELILFITMLAVARIGASAFSIPVNTPTIQNELMIKNVEAKWLLTDILDISTSLLPLFMDIQALLSSKIVIDFTVHATDPDAPWLFITGSGSTGKSKIMPVQHEQQIQRMKSSLKWLPLSNGDCITTMVHLDHHVSKRLYLEAFNSGLTIVLFDRTNLNPFDLCRRFNISLLHATVFHIHTMLKHTQKSNHHALPSLKALLVGGSSVPDPLRKQIAKILTPNLYVRYGINEVGTIAEAHAPDVYEIKGTVGKVLPNVSVEIINANFQTLDPGEIGFIRIKSSTTLKGYKNDEEATEKAFKEGWFYPGDLGKFTLDGQLIHLGRADDMIIMAGNNIYPSEIEHCITSHPNIEDAVAIPVKSDIAQEIPVCAVVLKEPKKSSEKELLDFTYQRLASRGPKRIIILDTIDRNAQGKVLRSKLVQTIQRVLTGDKDKD